MMKRGLTRLKRRETTRPATMEALLTLPVSVGSLTAPSSNFSLERKVCYGLLTTHSNHISHVADRVSKTLITTLISEKQWTGLHGKCYPCISLGSLHGHLIHRLIRIR
jgi:hypothetical protein